MAETLEVLRALHDRAVEKRKEAQRAEWAAELAVIEAEGRGHIPYAAWLRAAIEGDTAGMDAAHLAINREGVAEYGPRFLLDSLAEQLGFRAVPVEEVGHA